MFYQALLSLLQIKRVSRGIMTPACLEVALIKCRYKTNVLKIPNDLMETLNCKSLYFCNSIKTFISLS